MNEWNDLSKRPDIKLVEDDHVITILYKGQVIARFSATGVEIDNILKEINDVCPN